MRADLLLVKKGLVLSRKRAQDLIAAGRVHFGVDGHKQRVLKASQNLPDDCELVVDTGNARDFVSRGGLKMEGALAHTSLDVSEFAVLDIGISTGGFTDCLLRAGAQSVVGVDVGHGQLAPELQRDPRLRLFEGVNARDLSSLPLLEGSLRGGFDLVVIDVSFISLTLVLSQAIQYLLEGGRVLALVKPQFEVGRSGLGKNGIVKDQELYLEVEKKIRTAIETSGLRVESYFASSIDGGDGNREFFVLAQK